MKATIGNLDSAMMSILDSYKEEVREVIDEEAKRCANDCKDNIRNSASSAVKGTGKYARSWKVTKRNGAYIVNAGTQYRLTHLLEYGHIVKTKSGKIGEGKKTFVEGRPHIRPAEEKAVTDFVNSVKRRIKK